MTPHRVRRFRTSLAATLTVVALAGAGCSGGDDEPEGEGESSADSSEAGDPEASVDPAKVSPEDLPDIPTVRRAKGALEDATFGDCATDEGDQTVSGEVTNSGDSRRDYAVVVSWTNDTSDVLARGVAVVQDLGGGATEEFEVEATVPSGVTQCTYFVQRGRVS